MRTMVALPFPDQAVPHILQAIKPHRLLVFLNHHRDYFHRRDLELPAFGSEPAIPFGPLLEVLLDPRPDTLLL
jgi:hypothetical protein